MTRCGRRRRGRVGRDVPRAPRLLTGAPESAGPSRLLAPGFLLLNPAPICQRTPHPHWGATVAAFHLGPPAPPGRPLNHQPATINYHQYIYHVKNCKNYFQLFYNLWETGPTGGPVAAACARQKPGARSIAPPESRILQHTVSGVLSWSNRSPGGADEN